MDNLRTRPLCLGCLAKTPDATFVDRLMARRLAKGLSRQQFAAELGLSRFAVVGFQRRDGMPRYTTLCKLVQALGPGLVGWFG